MRLSKNEYCKQCGLDSRKSDRHVWFQDAKYCSTLCRFYLAAVQAQREQEARENFEKYGRRGENW